MSSNEQIAASKAWIERFYEILDSNQIDQLVKKYFKPDAELIFGNLPPIRGLDAIRTSLLEQAALIDLKHKIRQIDVLSDRIYVQSQARIVVNKDPEQKLIDIKAITLFWKHINEDQTSKIDIYYDPSPVKERIIQFSEV